MEEHYKFWMCHTRRPKKGAHFENEDIIFTFVYLKKSQEESKIIHLWKQLGRLVYEKDNFHNVTCRGPAQCTVSFLSDIINSVFFLWSMNTGKGLSFKVRFALVQRRADLNCFSRGNSLFSSFHFLQRFIHWTLPECVLLCQALLQLIKIQK